MTQTTTNQPVPGNAAIMNPRLEHLLETGEFDWEDPRHREAYLKHWMNQPVPREEDH